MLFLFHTNSPETKKCSSSSSPESWHRCGPWQTQPPRRGWGSPLTPSCFYWFLVFTGAILFFTDASSSWRRLVHVIDALCSYWVRGVLCSYWVSDGDPKSNYIYHVESNDHFIFFSNILTQWYESEVSSVITQW